MRKQQENMSVTENNIVALKSHLENKIVETKDMTLDLKNKLENEKEEKRTVDQQLSMR
jgi:hypothetical protein